MVQTILSLPHNSTFPLYDRGTLTAIVIELSNLSDIVNVHIAQVKIPITLLSVYDADHHDYYVV